MDLRDKSALVEAKRGAIAREGQTLEREIVRVQVAQRRARQVCVPLSFVMTGLGAATLGLGLPAGLALGSLKGIMTCGVVGGVMTAAGQIAGAWAQFAQEDHEALTPAVIAGRRQALAQEASDLAGLQAHLDQLDRMVRERAAKVREPIILGMLARDTTLCKDTARIVAAYVDDDLDPVR